MRLATLVALILLVPAAAPAAERDADAVRNAYEWSAVAPVVVAGTSLGEDGKHFDFRVTECLRGDLPPGAEVRVDVRSANRDRDREIHPKALRLDAGEDYVLLLDPGRADARPARYALARGVDGARLLPLEGREAFLEALRAFIAIQEADGEEVRWHLLARALDGNNPWLIETALQLFVKFRRGEPETVLALVPLLDHPREEIREGSARLLGTLVDRHWDGATIPEDQLVRTALVGRARRDESVDVRRAATEALAGFPAELVDEVLDEIARTDPEQQVRYAAELIRLEHRRASSSRPSPD